MCSDDEESTSISTNTTKQISIDQHKDQSPYQKISLSAKVVDMDDVKTLKAGPNHEILFFLQKFTLFFIASFYSYTIILTVNQISVHFCEPILRYEFFYDTML